MGQSVWNEGPKAFTAYEELEAFRRVKIRSGTTAIPPEVEYADAGESSIGTTIAQAKAGERVTVMALNDNGTRLVVAADSFAVGAVLYGANDGKVSDSASGSAQFQAIQAAGANGDVVEAIVYPYLATAAGSVSIADAGSFTAAATVEAALQEIYQNLISVQGFIPISLMSLREVSSMAVGNIAANGGLLASDTTPILQPINGATDGCQEVVWAAGNADPVIFQVPLPPNLDDAADLVLHTRMRSGGTTNAVGFTVDSWFNEGDTKVTDTSETNQTNTWEEKIATIAAADVPAGAQTVTISLTPVTHATDNMQLSAVWLEYKTKILTS